MNSREKGKRGEREFRDVLREAGYCKTERGQQFRGGPDSPDVNCPELPDIHFEVKRCQNASIYKWILQAETEKRSGQFAIVAHKKNHCEWLAILPMNDLLEIIRRSELPKLRETILLEPTKTGEDGKYTPPVAMKFAEIDSSEVGE